jgi:hypothetical protein
MKKMTFTPWRRLLALFRAGVVVALLGLIIPAFAQTPNRGQTDPFLAKLIQSRPDLFRGVLEKPDVYDVQIVYTQINRDAKNRPSFKTFRYQVDKDRYFYPASTVKFPAVLLALEKLNRLGIPRATPMLTDSSHERQVRVWRDTTAQNGFPSVEHYARKILIVSDNAAYNRLYEFIGQCALNDSLRAKGYGSTRIVHRLETAMTPMQNAITNAVVFGPTQPNGIQLTPEQLFSKTPIKVDFNRGMASSSKKDRVLHFQNPQYCERTPQAPAPILRGTGYMVGGSHYTGDSLVNKPFDFTTKNAFPLDDQQAMLRAVLFPESVPARQRFKLTPADYRFVYQYMSQLPRETRWPNYRADTSLYDSYCKFLAFGDNKTPMPKSVRVFNKVGDAYGYLIDNAYIVDFERGIEFMLTATIATNADGIFNDGKYDYDSIGYPFLGNLGRLIYDYEATRKKNHKPDLSRFQVDYGD